MRVDWCVSSWFRIKNTHSHTPPPPRPPGLWFAFEFLLRVGDCVTRSTA